MLRLTEELEVNSSLKERVLCMLEVVSAEELNLPLHCPELDASRPWEQFGHPETPFLRQLHMPSLAGHPTALGLRTLICTTKGMDWMPTEDPCGAERLL